MRTFPTIAVLAAALAAITPRPVPAEHLPIPFIARDACPFECCSYGTWVPRRTLRVFARERDTSRVAFTLAKGDSFEAVTGNVHVLRSGIAVVRRAFSLDGPGGPRRAMPGDRIYLLDPGSEGALHVWHKGHFVWTSEEYFYFDESTPKGDPARVTRLVRDVQSEWWVEVRARDGRHGWLLMSDDPYEPMEVDGADLCG